MTFSLEEGDDLDEEEGGEVDEAGEEAELGRRLPTPVGYFAPSQEVDPRRYGLWGCLLPVALALALLALAQIGLRAVSAQEAIPSSQPLAGPEAPPPGGNACVLRARGCGQACPLSER